MREVDVITKNLLKITLNDGFEFKKLYDWKYPDGYVFDKSSLPFSGFVGLYKNNIPIGHICFSVIPKDFKGIDSKTIRINFLQGVLQKQNLNDGINFKNFRKPWHKIIMEGFLFSCSHLFKQDYKIFYLGIEDLKYIDKTIQDILKQIKKDQLKIKEIKKKQKRIKLLKRSALNKIDSPNNLEKIKQIEVKLEKDLEKFNLRLKSYSAFFLKQKNIKKPILIIRDYYFKKDGQLNLEKLKVRDILNKINNAYKKKKAIIRYNNKRKKQLIFKRK